MPRPRAHPLRRERSAERDRKQDRNLASAHAGPQSTSAQSYWSMLSPSAPPVEHDQHDAEQRMVRHRDSECAKQGRRSAKQGNVGHCGRRVRQRTASRQADCHACAPPGGSAAACAVQISGSTFNVEAMQCTRRASANASSAPGPYGCSRATVQSGSASSKCRLARQEAAAGRYSVLWGRLARPERGEHVSQADGRSPFARSHNRS